jgi:hypothetical protein
MGVHMEKPSLTTFKRGKEKFFFFFDLEIEIYTTHMHTLFGERKEDSNLCQMGGMNSLAPLGQMPSGQGEREVENI